MGDFMEAKEKTKNKTTKLIFAIMIIIILIFFTQNKTNLIKETYAIKEEKEDINTVIANNKENKVKISNAKKVDIDEIIKNNTGKISSKEEIYEKQEELEYLTKYRYSNDLYIGTTNVAQEGRNGYQTITMKKIYDEQGNLIKEEQVSCVVKKSSINKIIEIGTKEYIKEEKKVEEKGESGNISFDMPLNRPSGFSLEQFSIALTDNKDKNKIFENNAQYFYYIEGEYNINGMFVAAIGIHESAWGTSRIAKDKYNLFGYGAYDSNPYNGAYTFDDYSESIDLIARVLVKYYINPSGSTIYDGTKASGKYYNGNTISSVNQKYATDKNWANSVYKHMQYLYDKIN